LPVQKYSYFTYNVKYICTQKAGTVTLKNCVNISLHFNKDLQIKSPINNNHKCN